MCQITFFQLEHFSKTTHNMSQFPFSKNVEPGARRVPKGLEVLTKWSRFLRSRRLTVNEWKEYETTSSWVFSTSSVLQEGWNWNQTEARTSSRRFEKFSHSALTSAWQVACGGGKAGSAFHLASRASCQHSRETWSGRIHAADWRKTALSLWLLFWHGVISNFKVKWSEMTAWSNPISLTTWTLLVIA